MSFPRYPKYKESGVEWLGQVPDHWESCRNKVVFSEIDDRCTDEDGELMTVSHITGVTPRSEREVNMFMAETMVGYKRCRAGDLVINTMWAWMGALGCSPCDGIVSPAYNVYRRREPSLVLPHYYDYLCRLPPHRTVMKANSSGVWESRLRLYPDAFLSMCLAFPPLTEQAKIVAFLDQETAKIDALVAEQQRLIELLMEKVKALVLSAFALPEAKQRRLGSIVQIISRPVTQREGEEYERIGLYNRGRGLFHREASEKDEMGDSDFFWIQEGDLIISGQFAWEGSVALASKLDTGCVVSHRFPVLRGLEGVSLTEYLFALLLTEHGNFLLNEHSRGAAGRNRPLNISTLLKENIPLPPLRFQQEVANAVHCKKHLLDEIAQQIRLLQERRTALISAAVTGQIDVRNQ
jgi:type I restriction enzyme S subunit